MKYFLKKKSPLLFVSFIIITMFITPGSSASKKAAPLGNKDVEIYYKSKKPMALLNTQYKNFPKLTGNSGRWEDEEKFYYTWDDGQVGFIMIAETESPQLALIALYDNFETVRGIKKGSTLDELLKAYPDNFELTEGGGGTWYNYKWTAETPSLLFIGRTFKISFFVEKNHVNSVMLKLDSVEADEIPLG